MAASTGHVVWQRWTWINLGPWRGADTETCTRSYRTCVLQQSLCNMNICINALQKYNFALLRFAFVVILLGHFSIKCVAC